MTLVAELDGVPRSIANGNALSLLDKVGLSDRCRHYPDNLSGGEQHSCQSEGTGGRCFDSDGNGGEYQPDRFDLNRSLPGRRDPQDLARRRGPGGNKPTEPRGPQPFQLI